MTLAASPESLPEKTAPWQQCLGLFCFCLCVFLLASCGRSLGKDDLQKVAGATMGTTYTVSFYFSTEASAADVASLKKKIDARLEALEQSMSTYRDDSELSRLNQAKPDQWLEVSQ